MALAAMLTGCTYAGPASLSATRPAYNLAIQQTNDQELLLNLVRLRYRDTTYFTSVERIAASLELNRSLGSQGVLEMNGLRNAPTASGPAPSREPEFRDFREAVRLLRLLQRDGRLDLVRAKDGDGIELRFTRGGTTSPEAERFRALTGLAPDLERYRIAVAAEAPNNLTLALTTRPVMSALHFLSTGVEVPARDLAAGKVRQTVRADGQPFDWQEMLEGLFRVRVADRPPGDGTAVRYRNAWFYIPDNDLESKSTFVLLTQIIALHSAPPSGAPPISYSIGK